jgi:hypothetical protein
MAYWVSSRVIEAVKVGDASGSTLTMSGITDPILEITRILIVENTQSSQLPFSLNYSLTDITQCLVLKFVSQY